MQAPTIKQVEAQTVISVRHTGSHSDIGGVYRQLHEWARERAVEIQGPGLTTFLCPANEFDPESALFEVCMPVAPGTQGDAKVTVKELPARTVAAIRVTGSYEHIPAHYTEMLAWLVANGSEVTGPPTEVYVKGPKADGSRPPEEFVTEIQFPVA